jgi:NAD(P)-dependent dehydrogenase (short-subunit alcohol dehydrogenase family)
MNTIVMTGGTSGFGQIAARTMVASPDNRLLLGARGRRRGGSGGVEALPLDLANLASVRSFASAVCDRAPQINALVLNAGLSRADADGRTVDGFETTFAVNHLGHYLLLRLLLSRLARGATVVLTTSGTHDPAEGTVLPPPRHADAWLLAYPDQDPDRDQTPRAAAGRAYSSSKLCTVLTARSLAAQPEAEALALTVIAYDPGPTPGTGLLRDAPLPVRAAWWLLGTQLRRLVPRFNSRDAAGRTLADLALGATHPPAGHVYATLRRERLTWPEPSELARRDDVIAKLWHDSATLVGLQSSVA